MAEANARLNANKVRGSDGVFLEGTIASDMSTVSMLGLDWFSSGLPPELAAAIEGSYKDQGDRIDAPATPRQPHLLVLASDCSYNPDAYPALAGTIKRLLKACRSSSPDFEASDERQALCLLAKKHRNSDEQSLWNALLQEGLQATLQQGRHDDYTRHAKIAGEATLVNGDAVEDAREEEAIGECGIYCVTLADDED